MSEEVLDNLGDGSTLRLIDAARYAEVKSAKATCIFALEVEEKFLLLLDNFFDFELELLKLSEISAIWAKHNHETSMLRRLSIDRRLVNLLTACRLYLDQTSHGFSRLYGKQSHEFTTLKDFKSDLYDANWGYRLMDALRNHVQHSGLPVNGISHSWSLINGRLSDYKQYVIIPQVHHENLAENDAFKKTVLKELQQKGKAVDLRAPVREYISCFVALHEKIQSILSDKLAKDRTVYELAATEYSTINGQAIKFPYLTEFNDDKSVKEKIALATDFLGYYDSLKEHNKVNPGLANSCASNSVQEKA